MKNINNFLKLWLLVLIILIYKTKSTDADLFDIQVLRENKITTATVDFTNVKTSNNQHIPNMFNINGIIQGGFDLSSLKIQNNASQQLTYNISYVEKNNVNSFCQNLFLTIYTKEFKKVLYQNNLNNLDLNLQNYYDDSTYVFLLNNNNINLGSCMFDFKITTPSEWNLNDEEIITNFVGS